MIFNVLLMLFVAYMAMSFWTIWFDMRKPFLMPFGIFKIFCSLGYKAPINDLPQGMDGLNKFGFGDANFQKWFADVNNRKYVSRLEFFAFNRQRLFELDAELTRRGLK